MSTFKIWKICENCSGEGRFETFNSNSSHHTARAPKYENCYVCKGQGKILWGFVEQEQPVDTSKFEYKIQDPYL